MPSFPVRALRAAALAALCLLVYALAPDAVGLANAQETLRLRAAAEMHERADWLLPTIRGEAYVAKPPLIYWGQLALAELRGVEPDVRGLRVVVAIGGTAGVLAVYILGAPLLRRAGEPPGRAETGALLAAATMAVGILYVRSSRVGELDVLLVAPVTIALWALVAAWEPAEEPAPAASAPRRPPIRWGLLAVATAACAAAALVKGPVPLALIAVALIGGQLAWCAIQGGPSRLARTLGAVAALAAGAVAATGAVGWSDWIGALIHAAAAWLVVSLVTRALASAGSRAAVGRALVRTQPWLVLPIGLGAVAAWWLAVRGQVGPELLAELGEDQVRHNLRVLQPASPVKNLGFFAYGLLPVASAAGVLGLAHVARERPRLAPAGVVILAWVVGGFILFSIAGKGVARYLTPVWPGVSLLAGWTIARGLASADLRPGQVAAWRAAVWAAVVVAAAAQTWWYGVARREVEGPVSPAPWAAAALDALPVEPGRTASWDVPTLTLEFYWPGEVDAFSEREKGPGAGGLLEWIEGRFAESAAPVWIVALEPRADLARRYGDVRGALDAAGLAFETVRPGPEWLRPRDDAGVVLLRVDPPAG